MLLAFVITVGNLATAEKVSDYELLLPIGFDARIIGKGVGQPVFLLLFSAIYACVLFMLATLFVGLLLCRTYRDTVRDEKQFGKSRSNGKESKRAHVIPTNRGKFLTESSSLHETEPRSESKQKNEDLWQAVRSVSGPTGFVCDL